MAWRIDENILRGEIDNRTRGCVTGHIQIAGIAEPLLLNLQGDCQPDLAGCLLTFENPNPRELTSQPPALRQNGIVGDITAARKVRAFDIPTGAAFAMRKRGETPPERMANGFHLEWHSPRNGHFVIESVDYQLSVSEPAWRFTPEELAERQRVLDEGNQAFITVLDADSPAGEWDEFRCEQFLRENDARNDKYGRLLKEFADHPDCERIIARQMGWTKLKEALDEQEAEGLEGTEPFFDEVAFEENDDPPDPAREGVDWVRDEHGDICHPLGKRANDALHILLDELKAAGHFPHCADEDLGDFVGHFMNLSVKLRAHLQPLACRDGFLDPPMLVAKLKRYLGLFNQALAAANALGGREYFTPEDLARHRCELLGIREDILALIKQLRAE